jgi:ribosomal protein S18
MQKLDRKMTMSAFKGSPNYKLQGSTFDAKHLEKIMNGFGNIEMLRSIKPKYTANEDIFQKVPYKQAKVTSSSRNDISTNGTYSDNLRPSPSFLTVTRNLQKQNIYSDQYDGPSSLILTSPDRKTDMIKSFKMTNPYQEERDLFRKSLSTMNFDNTNSKSASHLPNIHRNSVAVPESSNLLKSSKQQYEDFLAQKQNLEEYKNFKETKNFLSKRDKIMKSGWRHGVVGVENPLDPDSEVYNDRYNQNKLKELNKELIDNRRKS